MLTAPHTRLVAALGAGALAITLVGCSSADSDGAEQPAVEAGLVDDSGVVEDSIDSDTETDVEDSADASDGAAGAQEASGRNGTATLEVGGATYEFIAVEDDGVVSICANLGASLQVVLTTEDRSATLTAYLVNDAEVEDPDRYDPPSVVLDFADEGGASWVSGDMANLRGVDGSAYPVDIQPDTTENAASGSVTMGYVEELPIGEVQEESEAHLSVQCT